VLSSKGSWWLLPMIIGFGIWLVVNPPDESIRGFMYFVLGLVVFTFLVVAIIVPASSMGMKKRIDELEARLKYLEQSRF
jgi:O-antigen ligase